jgi:hypothetical protein
MKTAGFFLLACLFFYSCSDSNDFDDIISNEWKKCQEVGKDTIDLSNVMQFDWDTMCFYSGAISLEEINQDLGFELKGFTDNGDRVIFLHKGKVVYHKEWFNKPSEPDEGTVFETDLKIFKISKHDSKFKIRKEGKMFYLKKI